MFEGCYSLKSINLPKFEHSKINNFDNLFYNCSSLESIDLSNLNTSNATSMSHMFFGCRSLKSINLSNFDTSLVTDMDYLFYECDSLNILDISNFDMSNCDTYSFMFSNIDNIKYINLYNFKGDKIILQNFEGIDNTLYVCQKDNILISQQIYNCCDYNFDDNKCNSIYELKPSDVETNNILDEISNEPIEIDKPNEDTINSYDYTTENFNKIISTKMLNNTNFIIQPLDFQANNNTKDIINSDSEATDSNNEVIQIPNKTNSSSSIYNQDYQHSIPDISYDDNNDDSETIDNYNDAFQNSKKANSNNSVSIGLIMGIIGGIIFVAVIIVVVICVCRKKNKIIVWFMTTNQKKIKILIDRNKKMKELIKIFFKKIKRLDLYNDKDIAFLKNGRNYLHDSDNLIKDEISEESNIILVSDAQEKIEPSFLELIKTL